MKALLLALAVLAATPAPAGGADEHPGYGVVQSLTRLPPDPGAESASAGATAPRRPPRPTWLVKVKLDDGSIQIREVKRREVKVGQRVLVTNAGDVLPE